MHEVVKIFLFLFTFATTFSGFPMCQEYSLVKLGIPTSQPIATDWEMLHVTSSVNGITAALQTPPQNCSHPSSSALLLTRPNLDILEEVTSWQPGPRLCNFSLSQKRKHKLNSTAFSWILVLTRFLCFDSYPTSCQWTPPTLEISRNQISPNFESKNTNIVIKITVKTPPTTCKTRNLFNLLRREFLSKLTLLPMNAKLQCWAARM